MFTCPGTEVRVSGVHCHMCACSTSGVLLVLYCSVLYRVSFPGDSAAKTRTANAGDSDLILGLGRSPGEGNGNSPQYSCLGNPMDRGAWWAKLVGSQRVGCD